MISYVENEDGIKDLVICGQLPKQEIFHSRYTFITDNFIIKFDRDLITPSTRTRWMQSAIEIALYESMDEKDRKFFVPINFKKPTCSSRGFVVQQFVDGADGDCSILDAVITKYEIGDIKTNPNDNCFLVNGSPLIFDWGVCSSRFKQMVLDHLAQEG